MALIKNGTITETDNWLWIDDDHDIPGEGDIVVGLERWQAERESLEGRNGGLALRLRSDQLAESIADDLHRFAMIALEFPKFTDGRAFSTARLLRERYGFTGELRAFGHIIQDQFLFLERSGFDALEVDDRTDLEAWRKAVAVVDLVYQAAADRRHAIPRLRGSRQAASRACR